jgi:class 3 adenylate cyclase/ligand-binding sensor domain-containing protein
MIRYISIISLILLFVSNDLKAQYDRLPITNYTIKEYGIKQEALNLAITQDIRGLMYFGNSYGVLEFDGRDWRFIPVKPAWVTALACDKRNRIYVGSQNEFGYLAPDKTGTLKYYSISKMLDKDDQTFDGIIKIHTSGDIVYFQASNKFFIYRNNIIKIIKPETFFTNSFMVKDELYVRQLDKGLMKFENGFLKIIKNGDFFKDKGVFAMLPYNKDKLLIVTYSNGLWLYDKASGNIKEFTTNIPDLIKTANIYGGLLLHNNNIALNTLNKGLIIIDINGHLVNIFDQMLGLKVNDVKQAFQDKQNNIWLALNNGISKIEYTSPLSYYKQESGIEGSIYCINKYNDKLYLGTSSGLFVQDKESEILKFRHIKEISNQVWSLINIEGSLIVGVNDGLYEVRNNMINKISDLTSRAMVYDNTTGFLFAGGEHGLAAYKKDAKWHMVKFFNDITNIYSIAIDKKNVDNIKDIWLGRPNGVIKLSIDEQLDYLTENYSEDDGLNKGYITPIEFDNKILFASSTGIMHFIDEQTIKQSLTDSALKNNPEYYKGYFEPHNFGVKDSKESITLFKRNNNITYIVSNNHVGYIKRNGQFIFQPFLPMEMGKIWSLFPDNNDLWIGSDEGLVVYRENKIIDFNQGFKVMIRQVVASPDSIIFNGTYYLGDTSKPEQLELALNQSIDQRPILNYKSNSLVFRFVSYYFNYNSFTQYSYKLEGFTNDWSNWQSEPNAVFSNLLEGKYKLLVRARNIYGIESATESFEFTILPPWYRTVLAYFGYGIIIILLIYIITKLAQVSLKRDKEKLEGIVMQRTIEIREEKEKSDHLLLNILPAKVVDELKKNGQTEPDVFTDVTVFFSDFVSFTDISSTLEPKTLIDELNDLFTAFDDIMVKNHCERIKTIGDAYMAVCGMPEENDRHAENMTNAALQIREYLEDRAKTHDINWKLRIGINSGKVTGGVVGKRKYLYDVFGDTVNTASRMESNSEPMKINTTENTYNIIKDKFRFTPREPIVIKGKGKMKMYFIDYK